MEARKLEEVEFHNWYRALYEQGGAAYEYYTSNKKWYSVDRRSREYTHSWLRAHVPGKRVLDYGCGGGAYSLALAEQGASRVDGIDISDESIVLCRARAAERKLDQVCHFQVMDCENLTFPDDAFDVVSDAGVLHHLDLQKVWPNLARVLKPGGSVLGVEALAHNPLFQAYRRLTPHLRTQWETEHILTVEQIESGLQYFRTLKIEYFHLASLAAVPLRRWPVFGPALRALEMVDEVLRRTPGVQRWAWIAVFILSNPRKDVLGAR